MFASVVYKMPAPEIWHGMTGQITPSADLVIWTRIDRFVRDFKATSDVTAPFELKVLI